MEFPETLSNSLRRVFDDGLDEILIFAFVFIFILLSNRGDGDAGGESINPGILPVIVIGVFLLLYFTIGREETVPEQDTMPAVA